MSAEEWRQVVGFPGYEVSSLGRVVSSKGGQPREMRGGRNQDGHRHVGLVRLDGRTKNMGVHALVAAAFIGPRPEGQQVRHLDGNPRNNVVGNLAYGTPSENAQDSARHGTNRNVRKTHCSRGHAYTPENTYQPSNRPTKRCCRACNRERQAERYALRKGFTEQAS